MRESHYNSLLSKGLGEAFSVCHLLIHSLPYLFFSLFSPESTPLPFLCNSFFQGLLLHFSPGHWGLSLSPTPADPGGEGGRAEGIIRRTPLFAKWSQRQEHPGS